MALDKEQQKQIRILTQLVAGRITTQEAALSLGKSVRWVEWKRPAFRREGAAAVVHGNTGRVPVNVTPDSVVKRILDLATGTYERFSHQQLTEMLNDREGISACRQTVRSVCIAGNSPAPRPQRRKERHRKRRERRRQAGDMVQGDGSPHDWLEGRGPRLTLINHIDDATGDKWGQFFEGETLEGYMTVFRAMVEAQGIPVSFYTDRTVIVAGASVKFKRMTDEPSGPSQFGRVLEELGVTVILANSAQAKGRVERTHGTDQDRLCSLLRLAGATNVEEANAVLHDQHLPDFHRRFTVPAADPTPAWRPAPARHLLDEIFCIKEKRTVARNNTVRIYGRIIDIPPGPGKRSYAGAHVTVHRRYDGTTGVFLDGTRIGGEKPLPSPRKRQPLPAVAPSDAKKSPRRLPRPRPLGARSLRSQTAGIA